MEFIKEIFEFLKEVFYFLIDIKKYGINSLCIISICGVMEVLKMKFKEGFFKITCEYKSWVLKVSISFMLSIILSFVLMIIDFEIKLYIKTVFVSFILAHFLYAGIDKIKPLKLIQKIIKKKLGKNNV